MAKKKRHTSKTKIQVLKRYLQKKEPISKLCEEFGCIPGSVYQWQEALFARGEMIFDASGGAVGRPRDVKKDEKKSKELEQKIREKDEIIAELMGEILKAKKLSGVI